MLVASEGHLAVFDANIHVYRMNRLVGVWRELAGWRSCNAPDLCSACVCFESRPGHSPGISKVFFSPSTQMPEQYLYETTTASFQILSNSPFITDPLIRRRTLTPDAACLVNSYRSIVESDSTALSAVPVQQLQGRDPIGWLSYSISHWFSLRYCYLMADFKL
jgi:hypothetical protein